MQTGKVNAYIGFAIKSGSIVYGVDNIEKKKSYAIIYAEGLAEASRKRLEKVATAKNASLKMISDEEMLSLFNNSNIKAFGVKNQSLATAIINSL